MSSKDYQNIDAHENDLHSKLLELEKWQTENEHWLRWSRQIADILYRHMAEHNLLQADLAKILQVSRQYVSRLLSGKENLSLKSIANIEEKLGISCITIGKS